MLKDTTIQSSKIHICNFCGKEFETQISCKKKFCSKECYTKYIIWKNLNTTCCVCGKQFHLKKYIKGKYKNNEYCCSRECSAIHRSITYSGKRNHQYGLKGKSNPSFKGDEIPRKNNKFIDIMVYKPEHPFANKDGRVKKHILVVEENHELFDDKFFENINGYLVLKKIYHVHHKDFNHNNNDITNLQPLTRSEHIKLHNSQKQIIRNQENGRIIGVLKRGELLENHSNNDNQQPSIDSNIYEGSTTNSRILTRNGEDGNTDTSALHTKNSGDDIV